jgi:hypothetical protein
MTTNIRLVLLFLIAGIAGACVARSEPDDRDGAIERERPTIAPRIAEERFYVVARPDYRKCAWPWCGGVFVAAVNESTTTCADGNDQADCYVTQMDWSALALDPTLEGQLDMTPGVLLMRGNIVESEQPPVGKIPTLRVTGLWQGVGPNVASGGFYLVKDNNIVCITFPCFSIDELSLNTKQSQAISGIDLATSGASQGDLQQAQTDLHADGVMVAGTHSVTSGPAGSGTLVTTTQIYQLVKKAEPEPCGDVICAAGTVCCNASCGMCAPPDAACVQVACEPCAHEVCSEGGKLTASCSSCAQTVCAADSYCCNTKWDGICVQEATDLCGACSQPPPPPPPPPSGCAHSECETGDALVGSCSSCAQTVCAVDGYCCSNGWDSVCADEAAQMCGNTCAAQGCEHPESQVGDKLTPSCSVCAGTVCGQDSYCCDAKWDGICVDEAAQLCN